MSSLDGDVSQNGSLKRVDALRALAEIEEFDFSRSLDKPPRTLNMERQRSCDERSMNELFGVSSPSPRPSSRAENNFRLSDHLDGLHSPGRRSGFNTPRSQYGFETHPSVAEAWDALRGSLVFFRGQPVGTIAALDNNTDEQLNYDQVFVRDFVPSALAFLMNGEPEIVKNFILKTLRLQSWEKKIDRFHLGEGVMPASFKVLHDPIRNSETLMADFEGFDTFPTLLCADGCCMIDRRMGVYGYPIEIQALFFMALRCALLLLKQDDEGKEFVERITKRLHALSFHMRSYYWIDLKQLNDIYRYKTEEYSHTAVNKFNVIPDSLPEWIFDFMPVHGGYFIGNVSPAKMDFRWFCLGNCIAILSSLATPEQSTAIMDLIESRWEELVGEMPLKVIYPAIESHEWRIVTGCDPKNTRWSYHNGGSWPVLLWLLTAACIKTGRPQIARRAIELAETRLVKDNWPEYYDGKLGRFIGKQARKFQTWSVAGYLVAKMLLEDPSHLGMLALEEDKQMKPPMRRSHSWTF
ncbi:hypothetical protein OIU85_028269 [Salix viminalis]|uniref:Alkaline/neutral invertase n=1 Tax=Salix viminalis TaxID=40686 RepID=A0A9Q0QKI2_SALVM|nr:hypothetical protein OIU85_028269 [Salix viminalis]